MIAAIVWTVIAAIGVLAGIVLIVEAVRDRAAVRQVDGRASVRTLLARSAVRTELLRMVTQGVFLAVGIVTVRFISSDSPPPSWFGALLSWGLILGSGCITANSVLGVLTRRKLERLLNEDARPTQP